MASRSREGDLYSVLNACRAWRFAAVDVLGSKLEGAAWVRARWPDPGLIDAAVALRRGDDAALDESAVERSFRRWRLGCVKPRRRKPDRRRQEAAREQLAAGLDRTLMAPPIC